MRTENNHHLHAPPELVAIISRVAETPVESLDPRTCAKIESDLAAFEPIDVQLAYLETMFHQPSEAAYTARQFEKLGDATIEGLVAVLFGLGGIGPVKCSLIARVISNWAKARGWAETFERESASILRLERAERAFDAQPPSTPPN